eukprot:GGOE01014182.1.p1 GENE.GGOE01014182.1~~GGOE01014182.1.p1  ORF type:complete len:174 (-),score=45.71 GGOE01014182.1:123-608(-)
MSQRLRPLQRLASATKRAKKATDSPFFAAPGDSSQPSQQVSPGKRLLYHAFRALRQAPPHLQDYYRDRIREETARHRGERDAEVVKVLVARGHAAVERIAKRLAEYQASPYYLPDIHRRRMQNAAKLATLNPKSAPRGDCTVDTGRSGPLPEDDIPRPRIW